MSKRLKSKKPIHQKKPSSSTNAPLEEGPHSRMLSAFHDEISQHPEAIHSTKEQEWAIRRVIANMSPEDRQALGLLTPRDTDRFIHAVFLDPEASTDIAAIIREGVSELALFGHDRELLDFMIEDNPEPVPQESMQFLYCGIIENYVHNYLGIESEPSDSDKESIVMALERLDGGSVAELRDELETIAQRCPFDLARLLAKKKLDSS